VAPDALGGLFREACKTLAPGRNSRPRTIANCKLRNANRELEGTLRGPDGFGAGIAATPIGVLARTNPPPKRRCGSSCSRYTAAKAGGLCPPSRGGESIRGNKFWAVIANGAEYRTRKGPFRGRGTSISLYGRRVVRNGTVDRDAVDRD